MSEVEVTGKTISYTWVDEEGDDQDDSLTIHKNDTFLVFSEGMDTVSIPLEHWGAVSKIVDDLLG